MYLAALKAAAEMAEAMGDRDFAGECGALAKKGGAYVDRVLFNGEYYAQKLDLADRSILEPFERGGKPGVLRELFMQAYWSDEYCEIKYQIGGGCLTDQILGQWHADLAGLGDLLSPERVASALAAIYRANFRPNLSDHFNPAGSTPTKTRRACSSAHGPKGRRSRRRPFPIPRRSGRGLEYMFASHLIARGLVDEGLTVVRAARARHDGSRRNPYNDIECGSHYARRYRSYAL